MADQYLDKEEPDAVRGRNIPIDGTAKATSGGVCSFGPGAGSGVGAVLLMGLAFLFGRRRR